VGQRPFDYRLSPAPQHHADGNEPLHACAARAAVKGMDFRRTAAAAVPKRMKALRLSVTEGRRVQHRSTTN
jgi:hypothetical protein